MKNSFEIPINRVYQKKVGTLSSEIDSIRSPQDAKCLVQTLIADADREHFVVISLNSKNRVMNVEIAHIGSLNTCVVHPREILKNPILSNAAAIILAHNHPSQDLTPSDEDIQLTRRIIEAGDILGIEVLDHIIVNNRDEIYSLKAEDELISQG